MSKPLEAKITVKDCTPYSCLAGIKNFCASTGLDYMTFLTEGYSVEELLVYGDIQAERVVRLVLQAREAARGQESKG